MQTELKVALMSLDIVNCDKEANIKTLTSTFERLPIETDVVVLPELFSTGFTSSRDRLDQLAETNGGETIALLHRLAARHNTAITGSFLAKSGSHIYNRAFFVEPSGDETFYDKRHLFSMSSESTVLTAGESPVLNVRFRGWNISVIVCYDLRFPVWCRNVGNNYDLMIVPANWPNSREFAWTHLLQARAIENQSYVIGLNRSGNDKFGDYNGMSAVFDFTGHTVEMSSVPDSVIQLATLNRDALKRWREDFPVWKDSDKFSITN